jgi:hypothetical protein
MRASMVLVLHAGQSGRWMIMSFALDQAGVLMLSVTGRCSDGAVMQPPCASGFQTSDQYCSVMKISRIATGFPQAVIAGKQLGLEMRRPTIVSGA